MTFDPDSTDADLVADAAAALLASVADKLGSRAPENQVIQHRLAIWACSSLSVLVPIIHTKPQDKCSSVPGIEFQIELIKCVTKLIPDQKGRFDLAAVTAESRELLKDGWALWHAVADGKHDGTLFGSIGISCSNVKLGDLRPLFQGDRAGWSITVELT